MVLLPGEDPKQFDELVQALNDEWQPDGFIEEDTVITLADYIWRRDRLDALLTKERFGRRPPDRNEGMKLLLGWALKNLDEPDKLRNKIVEELKGRIFPRVMNRDSGILQAIHALQPVLKGTEFWNQLPPAANVIDRAFETLFDAFGINQEKRQTVMDSYWKDLEQWTIVMTAEEFERELGLRERLDSMIDRCIKRLLHLKAGKRMVALDSSRRALPKPNAD